MKKFPHYITTLGYRRHGRNGTVIVTTMLATSAHEPVLKTRTEKLVHDSLTLIEQDELDHIINNQKHELIQMYTKEIDAYVSIRPDDAVRF